MKQYTIVLSLLLISSFALLTSCGGSEARPCCSVPIIDVSPSSQEGLEISIDNHYFPYSPENGPDYVADPYIDLYLEGTYSRRMLKSDYSNSESDMVFTLTNVSMDSTIAIVINGSIIYPQPQWNYGDLRFSCNAENEATDWGCALCKKFQECGDIDQIPGCYASLLTSTFEGDNVINGVMANDKLLTDVVRSATNGQYQMSHESMGTCISSLQSLQCDEVSTAVNGQTYDLSTISGLINGFTPCTDMYSVSP